ncbi:hypothetical protein BsWGS_25271 [Bradybaena similaris]
MRLGRINRTSAYLIVVSSLCCMMLVFIPNVDVLPARRSFLDNPRRFSVGPDRAISRFERRRDEEAYKVTSRDEKNDGPFFLKLKEGNVKFRDSLNGQPNERRKFEQIDRQAKYFLSLETTKKSRKAKEVDSLNAKNGFSLNAEQRETAKPRLGDLSSPETMIKAIEHGSEEKQARNDQTAGRNFGANRQNEKREDSLNLPGTIRNEDLRSVKPTGATPDNRDEDLTQEQAVKQRTASIRAENRAVNSTSQRI